MPLSLLQWLVFLLLCVVLNVTHSAFSILLVFYYYYESRFPYRFCGVWFGSSRCHPFHEPHTKPTGNPEMDRRYWRRQGQEVRDRKFHGYTSYCPIRHGQSVTWSNRSGCSGNYSNWDARGYCDALLTSGKSCLLWETNCSYLTGYR